MNRLSLFTLMVLLGVVLTACSTSPSSPQPQTSDGTNGYTEEEVVSALNELFDDLDSASDAELLEASLAAWQVPINKTGCPALEQIFKFIRFSSPSEQPQPLSTPSGSMLARGSYHYDPVDDRCTRVAGGDKLVLVYPYETKDETMSEAKLIIDWEAGSSTLDVAGPAGELVEVPTAMNLRLALNGKDVADLNVELAWYNTPSCGTEDGILEPTRVRLNGDLGSLTLIDVGYDLSDTALSLGGELDVVAGIHATLALDVQGKLTRGPCFSQNFRADSGSFAFGLESSVTLDSHRLELEVALRDAVFTDVSEVSVGEIMLYEVQSLVSVGLEDGTLRLDDEVAAQFSGVLDDSNYNGVSGENVMLTFSGGGSTTLETFLTENDFGITPLQPLGD